MKLETSWSKSPRLPLPWHALRDKMAANTLARISVFKSPLMVAWLWCANWTSALALGNSRLQLFEAGVLTPEDNLQGSGCDQPGTDLG